ncbi:MAG: accessory factor UbiK family protein [Pseudomonadota bacterium]
MDTHFIDDLAQRLAAALPPGLHTLRQDLEHNFNAVLRARLEKLDLVTRDEFDAQTRVLARSRAKLEELERKIAELEQRLS